MTEKDIISKLRSRFDYNYKIENAYIFNKNWESDFFAVSHSGYGVEFEIKTSVSDYRADFKKIKHKVLDRSKKGFCPNKFYYVVPEKLIKISDIPHYAGLIYVSAFGLEIIKQAPFIHKDKHDFRTNLCDKFYHRLNDERMKVKLLEQEVKNIEQRKLYLEQKSTKEEQKPW